MVTIIISIVIAVIVFIVIQVKKIEDEEIYSMIEFIIVIGIFIGLFVPVSGYQESKLFKTIKLEEYVQNEFLKEEDSKLFFQYEFKYKVVDADNPKVTIIEESVRKTKSKIKKDEQQCPRIEIYRKRHKKSIWTFGIGIEEEYIFYVPSN